MATTGQVLVVASSATTCSPERYCWAKASRAARVAGKRSRWTMLPGSSRVTASTTFLCKSSPANGILKSPMQESRLGSLGAKTTPPEVPESSRNGWGRKQRQNGTYLFELAAQPGGPEGRPHIVTGSWPIVQTGRPRGVRPCSPAWSELSSHLVPCPVSTNRPHFAGASQRLFRTATEPTRGAGLRCNHARYC